eukprot:CAMPEP_0172907316 /NCGR_PEP_ID=MMETSP1075-20121228/178568_1 /TAXON_ID=2916 /ORGANISM="Ceratium fusus, Strain PA161109" /LENGTH=151 /DNA_ID=CAMNT_0013764907 /DNA_START=72 /DNA_END=523 /DNA_ORIENTATION=+
MDSDVESLRSERWIIPWSAEEVTYVVLPGENKFEGSKKEEVAIEYRRGCWMQRRHAPLHSHSMHNGLCGPDVEARLPSMWRELADKLWLGILALKWGEDLSPESVIIVEAAGGHKAAEPLEGMASGCSSSGPRASVVIIAPTERELEQARA